MVGFSRVARLPGFERAIGFDMGGTSTDVSRFDGRYELQYETEKAGVRVVAPMMAIETVAAGGGSICRFDGVKLAVGPAECRSGSGTGLLRARRSVDRDRRELLPGQDPARALSRSRSIARPSIERLEAVRDGDRRGDGPVICSWHELADGFLQVANANMVKAIRSISVAKGYDPRDYVLVAFGGAAPQHACAIADELGIRRVLNHPDAGILSAYGIGMADVVRHRAAGVYRPLDRGTMSDAAAAARAACRGRRVDRGAATKAFRPTESK